MAFGKWLNGVLQWIRGQVLNASDVNTSIGEVYVPIGTVIPWAKSISGTPTLSAYWAECNGQTVSDAESPFNGQTLPNLNGNNNFLRGATTSGTTGGAATHVHAISGTTSAAVNANTAGTSNNIAPSASHTHTYSGAFAAGNNLPAYYNAVMIIRIK